MKCSAFVFTAVAAVSAAGSIAFHPAQVYAQDDYNSPFQVRQSNTDEPVYLEADQIDTDQETGIVTASGNVRITYGDRVLRANSITYSLETNRIQANGLITITNPDGTTFQATEAQLDDNLNNGLITSARAMLSNGGRVAAESAQRKDGNKTFLSKAVFSPCKVCEESPDPLWQVRAAHMVHDEEKRDYIYKDIYFDVLGYPVAYLPYFSHPDETVKRRSGFLTPTVGAGSSLGYFAQVPYYYDLASNRDLTIAPLVATDEHPVLGVELRGLETYGSYTLDGSISYGDVDGKSQMRGHIFADGVFNLGQGWGAGFDINRASDDSYLRKYNISDIDRLTSRVFTEKYTDTGYMVANTYAFQSFREDEFSGTIPLVLPELRAEQTTVLPYIGGIGMASVNATHLSRDRGQDVTRGSATVGWEDTYLTRPGILVQPFVEMRGDVYYVQNDDSNNTSRTANINSDSGDDNTYTRFAPLAGIEARYPFINVTKSGSTHVIEPIVQAIVAPKDMDQGDIPNEDSLDVEFDETALFSTNRFNGFDRWESGSRLNLGVKYDYKTIHDFEGTALIGQSFSLDERQAFSETSGLRDSASDYVGAWSLRSGTQLSLAHRFRLDPAFRVQRNEVYADTHIGEFQFAASYVFLEGEANADVERDRSEGNLYASYNLNSQWQFRTELRRDLEENRFIKTLGGLTYHNECIEVDLAVSRRYNDTDGAPSSTDFGLRIRLLTFVESGFEGK